MYLDASVHGMHAFKTALFFIHESELHVGVVLDAQADVVVVLDADRLHSQLTNELRVRKGLGTRIRNEEGMRCPP